MSVAYSLTGQTARRDALLDWVLAQSRENRYLMGELFCRGTVDCPQRGDYRGSVPMIGFGPGAYLIALETRANPETPICCADPSTIAPGLSDPERTTGLPDPDPDPDPDGTTAEDSGCSCRAGGNRAPGGFEWVLFPLALMLLRRRRR
jgi:MYXO-CTERM domain-containing protein